MEIDGEIRPTNWERGLGLMAGLVAAKRDQGVRHPGTKEGKTVSILRDELNGFAAKAYGDIIKFPDQDILNWWTAFTIMVIDSCEVLVSEHLWLSESDLAEQLAQHKWTMGTRHIDAFGHDAVIVHLDYWLDELEGTQIASSDFSFSDWGITPTMFEETTRTTLIELGKWALTGMMVAADLWDLPPAPEEELNEA